MLRLAAAVVLLLSACRASPVVEATSVLTVQPAMLVFPDTPVGSTSTLEVELSSAGNVDREVTASAGETFSPTARSLTLPASSSAKLLVRFSPAALGSATGTLRLASEGDVLEVALSGLGVEPAICPAPAACRVCGGAPAPDHTPCESPCLEQASCLAGACVGAPKSCDDGDRCALDVCEPALGCVHPAVSCVDPADLCRVGQCDPVSGCSTSPAADGTRCGANDCAVAHVCMAGACVERPPPDGSRCGEATPCQPAPQCLAGKCVPGPVTPLQPAWSVTVASGVTLVFPGVSDAAGNLYWFEQRATTTDLVSVDRGGVERFRAAMLGRPARFAGYPVEDSPLLLISKERLLAVVDEGSTATPTRHVEVRSTLDGALVWEARRAELAPAIGLAAGLPLYIMSANATSGSGRVILNLRTNAGGSAWSAWIVSLDGATGAVQWTWRNTYLSATVVDEQGVVYAYEDLFVHSLNAIDPAGTQRWRLSQNQWSAIPGATWQGLVVTTSPSRLFSAADGGLVREETVYWGREPLLGFGHLVSTDSNTSCHRSMLSMSLSSPAQPIATWAPVTGNTCIYDPMLTSRATVLVGSGPMFGGTGRLFEFSLDGGQLFSCPLTVNPGPLSALIDDAWVTANDSTLSLFSLPGLKLAPHGWVSQAGGRARAKTPQP